MTKAASSSASRPSSSGGLSPRLSPCECVNCVCVCACVRVCVCACIACLCVSESASERASEPLARGPLHLRDIEHAWRCTCTFIAVHMDRCLDVCAYVHTGVHVYAYVCMYVYNLYLCASIYVTSLVSRLKCFRSTPPKPKAHLFCFSLVCAWVAPWGAPPR